MTFISLLTFLLQISIDINEEADEYKRDIVGDDVSSFIHHLYNPTAKFHRYWSPKDFSEEEKQFSKKIAIKSLLNLPLITPFIFNKTKIQLNERCNIAFNTGYIFSPFGDFIDETFYFQKSDVLKGPLNLIFTARQFENRNRWFPEFIFSCNSFTPIEWITLNGTLDFWLQPENLSFNENKSFTGGSVALGCNVYPFKPTNTSGCEFGINLNLLYKTKGYMPEVMPLDKAFVFTAGLAIKY